MWGTAKEIELQGGRLYERMARNAPREDLAGVYAALARDERRHWEFLDNLEKSLPPELFASASAEPDVDEVFEELSLALRDDEEALRSMRAGVYDFARALALEQASIEYYEGLRRRVGPGVRGVVIDQIIAEERRHEGIMEGLLMMARRPAEWTESIELYHVDDMADVAGRLSRAERQPTQRKEGADHERIHAVVAG
jgi:rubrerythrin